MEKYVGKYESKEKTRKSRILSAKGCLLKVVIIFVGCGIMALLGWEDDSSRAGRYSTEFVVGLVAVALVCWIIDAVGNAIHKKKKNCNRTFTYASNC